MEGNKELEEEEKDDAMLEILDMPRTGYTSK